MGLHATAAFAATTERSGRRTLPGAAVIQRETWHSIRDSVQNVLWVAAREEDEGRFEPERDRQFRLEVAQMIRCVFGNLFRPCVVNPAWLTWNDGTVVKLAQGIYEERAFDRLPILGDALLDAGCQDNDILEHCRQAGPHVLGCHVVDLLTGRS
jgi:hypothetical protein